MSSPSLRTNVFRLALAGEQAGLTVEQMIWMLNSGISIEDLIWLIEWRLRRMEEDERFSRWIM